MELVEAKEALGQITQYCSEPPIFYESVDVKTDDKGGHKRIRIEMDGSFFLYKDKYIDITDGATHYHAKYIDDPRWARADRRTATIDQHRFFRL